MRVNVGVCNERLGVWRRDEAALLQAAGWAGQGSSGPELRRTILQAGDAVCQTRRRDGLKNTPWQERSGSVGEHRDFVCF